MPTQEEIFKKGSATLVEALNVDEDEISPSTTLNGDLGAESIDFLDIVFAIDKEFGIKVPVEQWTQDVNAGKAPAEEYFVMKNLALRIEELVAAKPAG